MGLPTALLLAKSGFIVNGYDIDNEKINLLHFIPSGTKMNSINSIIYIQII